MSYYFNLRITCWPLTQVRKEHALFNMSRIQQTTVFDLHTSNVLISVLYHRSAHFKDFATYQSLQRNMSYYFNLRITCWPLTQVRKEHALFNMSRIQQTTVFDLHTSNVLISVLYHRSAHFKDFSSRR